MGGILQRLKEWWDNTERTQKVITLGGIATLVLLLVGTFMLASRPKYETIFTGLSSEERGKIASTLRGMGVDARYDEPGSIAVPAQMVDEVRFRLAETDVMPQSQEGWGFKELTEIRMGVTPTVEQETLKAIVEGKLARTIRAAKGLQDVTVQITLPPRMVFQTEERPPTASVMVREGKEPLTKEQARTIASFVAGAVPRMQPKNVVVTNQDLVTLWSGKEEDIDPTEPTKLAEQIAERKREKLQALLDTAYGVGATRVNVSAVVDLDETETSSAERKPSEKPITEDSKEEQMEGRRLTAGGIAGAEGNMPPNGAPATRGGNGSDSSYTGTGRGRTFALNEVLTTRKKALGEVKSMAITVVVNKAKVSDLTAISALAVGELKAYPVQLGADGLPLAGEPFQVTVQGVEFDQTAEKAAAAASEAAASQVRMQQLISMLPIGALLLIGFLVMRQLSKVAKQMMPAPVQAEVSGDALALTLPTNLSAEELGQMDAALMQLTNAADRTLARPEDGPMHVEEIRDRIHMPLEQLKRMATERPALVAMLVKSTMLEDRR